ncbi:hypothetical protein BDW59DRAFT_119070 [Aspergillus cavernicola]|uniref:Secreted protein n=1 Tax=Aspergillus cavernicola TaxID=176166 RepID=A0ABR4HZ15_9EURO
MTNVSLCSPGLRVIWPFLVAAVAQASSSSPDCDTLPILTGSCYSSSTIEQLGYICLVCLKNNIPMFYSALCMCTMSPSQCPCTPKEHCYLHMYNQGSTQSPSRIGRPFRRTMLVHWTKGLYCVHCTAAVYLN